MSMDLNKLMQQAQQMQEQMQKAQEEMEHQTVEGTADDAPDPVEGVREEISTRHGRPPYSVRASGDLAEILVG